MKKIFVCCTLLLAYCVSACTLLPKATHVPLSLGYYQLRVEYSTTSDWTTLELGDTSNILSMKLVEKLGNPTHTELYPKGLSLNQPLANSQQGQVVGLTVDYIISPNAFLHPFPIDLYKGSIGESTLSISLVTDGKLQLLIEITHKGAVVGSGGRNPKSIQIDFGELKDISPLQAEIKRPARKMLWAFYYPWYSLSDWSSSKHSDRPQTPYDSVDPEAIVRHIEQAQQAGIDGFIFSWWGPPNRSFELLLLLAQERGFSVSIYLEILMDDGPLNEDEIFQRLVYAIDEYGQHPAFFKVDGKPVIVIWASQEVPLDTWQGISSRLREQGRNALFIGMGYNVDNLAVFDGIHEYSVFTGPSLAETYQSMAHIVRTYSLFCDSSDEMKTWIATVQPGYDDRLIPGREGFYQDRRDGQFYRTTFEAALKSEPDWIFITSWNEWPEHTYIEPSELYGDLYLQITREFADKWKGGG